MKIAIPTKDFRVDEHFGYCDSYTVYTIGENNKVIHIESFPSPRGCGCKNNIATVLQEMGVTIMLAGSVGDGAYNTLGSHGIKVYRGCSGSVSPLIKAFLSGKITDSGEACKGGEDGYPCKHTDKSE